MNIVCRRYLINESRNLELRDIPNEDAVYYGMNDFPQYRKDSAVFLQVEMGKSYILFIETGVSDNAFPVVIGGGYKEENATVMILKKLADDLTWSYRFGATRCSTGISEDMSLLCRESVPLKQTPEVTKRICRILRSRGLFL